MRDQIEKPAPALTARDWQVAAAGLLVFLFVLLASRDIGRPYDGLHSWDAAVASWAARSHLVYGLGYTKGLTTLAVGYPPPAVPPWYLDHPQLHALLDTGAMAIFGRNEAALRLAALILTAASLPFLIGLLRRLYDEETAVLATFLFIIFPITSYFNAALSTCWLMPFWLLAYWCYLSLIGELPGGPPPGKRHLVGLASALFILPQLSWIGFFYVAAIGSHYALRCLAQRRRPDRSLLLALVLSPAASAALVFGVLLHARMGDWRSLIGLYAFRGQIANGPGGGTPLAWLARQREMVQSNFTLPAALIVGAYLASEAAARIRARHAGVKAADLPSRAFVQPWLFIMPGILYMVVLTGSFWAHEMAYLQFSPPIAIAAALGILRMRDRLLARGRAAANAATFAIIAVICGFAARGIDDYYAIPTWSPREIDMFRKLNRETAPDEIVLTYENYLTADNPNKLPHLRPEIAWYLDREMVVATTLEDVERRAAAGKSRYYLVSTAMAPAAFVEQLKARYSWEIVQVRHERGSSRVVFDEGDHLIFFLQGVQSLMNEGLAALFSGHNPTEAARCFRKVLAINPDHYGANYQLARTLDLLGLPEQAETYWKKTLELARRFADAETAGAAMKRLKKGP